MRSLGHNRRRFVGGSGSDEAAPAACEPVLDRSVLRSVGNLWRPGAPDPVEELCSMYLEEMSRRVAVVGSAALAGDSAELLRQAHAIKGAAGCFGAGRMAAVARHLEETASTPKAQVVAAELAQELERLRTLLEGE